MPAPKGADNMSPSTAYYAWQNFSSMTREAVSASASKTSMERSHHLTACLYFGIAALEGFINNHMREHLEQSMSEDEITDFLREGRLMDKLKKWPKKIIGKRLEISADTMKLLREFNLLRGNLTHPKTHGHELSRDLDAIDPAVVVNSVAEYIVHFHVAAGTTFPYWIFGWNYLNPRPSSYQIEPVNDYQFVVSLAKLGLKPPTPLADEADAWLGQHLGTFKGYCEVRDALAKLARCEPRDERFPYQPVLCRRWWIAEHQQSCGCVTREAIQRALDIDTAYAAR